MFHQTFSSNLFISSFEPKFTFELVMDSHETVENGKCSCFFKDFLIYDTHFCCFQVKIKLPDTRATDVILDVKEKFLDLRTQKQ